VGLFAIRRGGPSKGPHQHQGGPVGRQTVKGSTVNESLLAATWNLQYLVKLYFQRYVPFKPLDDGTEVFVVRLNREMQVVRRPWPAEKSPITPEQKKIRAKRDKYQRVYTYFYPMYPGKDLGPGFSKIFKMFLANWTLTHRFLEYKGEGFLLTAFPGSSLPGILFPCGFAGASHWRASAGWASFLGSDPRSEASRFGLNFSRVRDGCSIPTDCSNPSIRLRNQGISG